MNNATLPRTLTELFPGFLSIGGMLSVVPEMHRYVVDVRHWITPADFIQMFAVGQAAPGLNVVVAGLIGWKVVGMPGAFIALGGRGSDRDFRRYFCWNRYEPVFGRAPRQSGPRGEDRPSNGV